MINLGISLAAHPFCVLFFKHSSSKAIAIE